MARNEQGLGNHIQVFIQFVVGVDLRNDAGQCIHGEVVVGAETGVDGGKAESGRIQAAARVGDAKKVLFIRFTKVVNLPVVPSELKGMTALHFGEVIHDVLYRYMRVDGGSKA